MSQDCKVYFVFLFTLIINRKITHQNVNFDKNEAFETGFGWRDLLSFSRFILFAYVLRPVYRHWQNVYYFLKKYIPIDQA